MISSKPQIQHVNCVALCTHSFQSHNKQALRVPLRATISCPKREQSSMHVIGKAPRGASLAFMVVTHPFTDYFAMSKVFCRLQIWFYSKIKILSIFCKLRSIT